MNISQMFSGPVQSVMDWFLKDPVISIEVIYRKYEGQVFDPVAGHNVETYSETIAKALMFEHTKESAALEKAEVQVGDRVFIFKSADAPDGMSLKDQIRLGDVTTGQLFRVKAVTPLFGLVSSVTVEGSK